MRRPQRCRILLAIVIGALGLAACGKVNPPGLPNGAKTSETRTYPSDNNE